MSKKIRTLRWGRIVLCAIVAAIFAFLVFPILVLFPISFSGDAYLSFPPTHYSFQWYRGYFSDASWIEATVRSLQVGLATTLMSLLLGIPLAFGLTRARFSGRMLLEGVVSAPIIVPHIVLSIAVYALFSQLQLIGEWYGIAIAHTVLALPFVTVVLTAALRDFDLNLETAAIGLGATRLRAIAYVTLPLLGPSVVSAAFLAFITSFDELIVAMFLSGANMTLPKKIFDSILAEIDPTVAAVSVIQIVVVYLVVLLALRFRLPGIYSGR